MSGKNELEGKTVFFSHPPFIFRTHTERQCLSIIHELKAHEVINPADYGLRDDIRELIKRAHVVIGACVDKNFTFLVWNEMEFGEKHGKKLYTLMVKNKHNIGPLVEGIPKDVKKLSREESELFSMEILSDHRESIYSIFIGNWGRRF